MQTMRKTLVGAMSWLPLRVCPVIPSSLEPRQPGYAMKISLCTNNWMRAAEHGRARPAKRRRERRLRQKPEPANQVREPMLFVRATLSPRSRANFTNPRSGGTKFLKPIKETFTTLRDLRWVKPWLSPRVSGSFRRRQLDTTTTAYLDAVAERIYSFSGQSLSLPANPKVGPSSL